MKLPLTALVGACLALGASSAQAQPTVRPAATPRPVGVYAGVEPGEAQPPPAYRRVVRRSSGRRGAVVLTWPGFTPMPSGGSRFFVQTTSPTVPEVRAEEGRLVLVFRNTQTHVANSRRWLETRFFNTPVVRARLERRRRDMALVFQMRAAATPAVGTAAAPGGNFHYVYIDFPPGNYTPVAAEAPGASVRPTPSQPPPAPARSLDPTLDAMDDERPPVMQ